MLNFTKDIGIDLGTANTLIYARGKGIIINEPSVVAINRDTNQVFAVGTDAKEMIGRTPKNIVAIRPIKEGVIADFSITEKMLREFMQKAIRKTKAIGRPRVVVCVPSGVTEVERRAVEEVVLKSGAKDVFLLEEPMAAAIGANMGVKNAEGNFIVDIGGGTTEVAVVSLGGIVVSDSIKIAGDRLTNDIISYIKRKYNANIGEKTAEEIKISLGGAALPVSDEKTLEICASNILTGFPTNITITESEIVEAMRDSIYSLIDGIKLTLEKTPPELVSDIIGSGMVLTGGGALIKGIDTLFAKELEIKVTIAAYPLNCVVIGAGRVLKELDELVRVGTQKKYKF